MSKTFHNIAACIDLSKAMRQLKNEFMVSVRGYLRTNTKDDDLFRKTEHAIRQTIEVQISERGSKLICPDCKCQSLDFDAGNGGDQEKDVEGNEYQVYSAVCKGCGKTVYLVAKYIGILNEHEYKNLRFNPTTSIFQG